jgi:hypothetical protein
MRLRQFIPTMVGAMVFAMAAAAESGSTAGDAKLSCDRECLRGFMDRYLNAVAANDPSRLPVTPDVQFTEDGQRLSLGDGLWNTATAVGTYKFYMADVEGGQIGFFGTLREAGQPVILAARLRVQGDRVSEIETIVERTVHDAENLEKRGAPDTLFSETIPPAERASRADLVASANYYFTGLQLNDGKGYYPFTDDCNRVENGTQETGNRDTVIDYDPLKLQRNTVETNSEKADASYSPRWTCRQQFESGLIHFVTRVRDRRFVVVDPERGLALAFTFFDHAAGKTRTFRVPDGRTITAGPTTPWTWEIAEVFRVERGKMRRIEAVYHRAPYGMNSGWSTWLDNMSTRARFDW